MEGWLLWTRANCWHFSHDLQKSSASLFKEGQAIARFARDKRKPRRGLSVFQVLVSGGVGLPSSDLHEPEALQLEGCQTNAMGRWIG